MSGKGTFDPYRRPILIRQANIRLQPEVNPRIRRAAVHFVRQEFQLCGRFNPYRVTLRAGTSRKLGSYGSTVPNIDFAIRGGERNFLAVCYAGTVLGIARR